MIEQKEETKWVVDKRDQKVKAADEACKFLIEIQEWVGRIKVEGKGS